MATPRYVLLMLPILATAPSLVPQQPEWDQTIEGFAEQLAGHVSQDDVVSTVQTALAQEIDGTQHESEHPHQASDAESDAHKRLAHLPGLSPDVETSCPRLRAEAVLLQ